MSDSREFDLSLDDPQRFRRMLHRNPETGFEVSNTASVVAQQLRRAGLEVATGIGGSGVVGSLRRGQGTRAIGLRADMDALPISEAGEVEHRSRVSGKFHGCGHDGHTTMLLACAIRLAQSNDFNGTVHFIFQPDEENGRGARAMIDDGLFGRFPMDTIYGLHNLPGLPLGSFATRTGALTAFEETFEIEIEGRGGHSSAPEQSIDPLVAGAEIVLAFQSIVSRALSPASHGVVSITELISDGARNIIPSTVTIRGDVRGYSDEVGATINARMARIVEGVAGAHGAIAALRYSREFEPLINTGAAVEKAVRAARQVPASAVDANCAAMGFSEDFAQFLRHCPGCFILMGNGTERSHGAALHNPHYDFNDAATLFGVEYWTRVVIEELGQ